jgi:3-phenylpropionate/cinnamic acid dioxygenase small subunit
MNDLQRLAIEQACKSLSIAYARHVDFRQYDKFTELFEEDAVLIAGALLSGREAIRDAMSKRSDKLRSRHVLTNIHIEVIDESHARGITYLTLYRHIGAESLEEKPIEIQGPAGVGHYTDEYVLTTAGWRIARRELEFAFQNPSAFVQSKK